jgi:hypothetical protein
MYTFQVLARIHISYSKTRRKEPVMYGVSVHSLWSSFLEFANTIAATQIYPFRVQLPTCECVFGITVPGHGPNGAVGQWVNVSALYSFIRREVETRHEVSHFVYALPALESSHKNTTHRSWSKSDI